MKADLVSTSYSTVTRCHTERKSNRSRTIRQPTASVIVCGRRSGRKSCQWSFSTILAYSCSKHVYFSYRHVKGYI